MKKILVALGFIVLVGTLCAFTINSSLPCLKCKGTGKIDVKKDCPTCKGAKKDKWGDDCYTCDGRGYITEKVTCPDCLGDGEQKKPVEFPEP